MATVNSADLYHNLVDRVKLTGNATRMINILAGYGPETEAQFVALAPEIMATLPGMGKATLAQALELQDKVRALSAPRPPVNYATEQRYRLIDFLLAQYGWINRAMVMDYFGISSACASNDIATYSDMSPTNIYYNAKSKRYEVTDDFLRVYP